MPRVVAVAASGGVDSTALLHVTSRTARALGLDVVALHVHHGLMPQAEAWLDHVRRQARRFGAQFACERLTGAPARGDSVEAWARRERYAALARLARAAGCDLVLLAQHRRDQAEAFLVQALRGGGAAGLAAMPRLVRRDGITWARPWLDLPRSAVEAYVRRHRLRHVDDASNADPRFARGRLRALWPALHAAFADAETTLARAAERAAADAALIAEVSAADLHALGAAGSPMPVKRWLALTEARRAAVLRLWLGGVLAQPVPETLVRRLMHELPGREHARWPAGADDLELRRGQLVRVPAAPRRASGPRRPGA
jgi:tRNA(Ile)-lysidine synthase